VEKREIPAKITDYAEELLDHVKTGLPGWPERVKLSAGELDRQRRKCVLPLPNIKDDAGSTGLVMVAACMCSPRGVITTGCQLPLCFGTEHLTGHARGRKQSQAGGLFIEECKRAAPPRRTRRAGKRDTSTGFVRDALRSMANPLKSGSATMC
jgi:hypothetical protein